jgi:AraC-like DNA-binding protein
MMPTPQHLAHAAETAHLRRLHAQPDIGAAAHVRQAVGLNIVRVVIHAPALILVRQGVKTVHTADGRPVVAKAGQGIALAAGQTVDFANEPSRGMPYEARWLIFDPAVVTSFATQQAPLMAAVATQRPAHLLSPLPIGLENAFDRASHTLSGEGVLPKPIMAHRLQEVLLCMALQGVAFMPAGTPVGTADRVRALLAKRPDKDWRASAVASDLAMSEATLRRRLASEGVAFGELLVDARMSYALTLLQATDQSISAIAEGSGYASPSRFAVRFRQRFGFAPSALRGHERAH